jgi:alkylation response protein AidB-like acyl-CoA dehydrogenase
MTLLAGVPLGIARRALDEFSELAKRKSRTADGARLADDPAIQVDAAGAEGSVQAARALVFDVFAQAWDTLQAGRVNTLDERTRMTLSVVQATRLCTAAVDVVFNRPGGGALYETSPLQRCFRDIHAAAQHIALSQETWKRVGKSLLGVEQLTLMV